VGSGLTDSKNIAQNLRPPKNGGTGCSSLRRESKGNIDVDSEQLLRYTKPGFQARQYFLLRSAPLQPTTRPLAGLLFWASHGFNQSVKVGLGLASLREIPFEVVLGEIVEWNTRVDLGWRGHRPAARGVTDRRTALWVNSPAVPVAAAFAAYEVGHPVGRVYRRAAVDRQSGIWIWRRRVVCALMRSACPRSRGSVMTYVAQRAETATLVPFCHATMSGLLSIHPPVERPAQDVFTGAVMDITIG
jgi:hypothetical protein